jgi:hypothetical protein
MGSQFRQQKKRIERPAMLSGFKVKMAAGNSAGLAEQSHYLSAPDPVSSFNQQLRAMTIICCQTPAVIDNQQHPVTTSFTSKYYFSRSGRMYRIPDISVQVNPGVEIFSTGQRILPAAET